MTRCRRMPTEEHRAAKRAEERGNAAMAGKLKIRVDQDKCQGHARCKSLAPELFDLDEFGNAHEVGDDPLRHRDLFAIVSTPRTDPVVNRAPCKRCPCHRRQAFRPGRNDRMLSLRVFFCHRRDRQCALMARQRPYRQPFCKRGHAWAEVLTRHWAAIVTFRPCRAKRHGHLGCEVCSWFSPPIHKLLLSG